MMCVTQLTSRDNALLKTVRLVASGAERAPQDLVLAEGVRVLEEAVKAGCPVEAALLEENFGAVARERAILEKWRSDHVRLFKMNAKLFKTVSSVQTPQGALALVKVPPPLLSDRPPAENSMIVFALGIQDPGNLGTLIRTAAAAGATMVCTGAGTVSARNPKSIRASAGAFFHLVPVENVDPDDFMQYCRLGSIRLYRTDAREGIIYAEADLRSSFAILFGNEGSGVDAKAMASLPSMRIPMDRKIESLNVAAAGAVILFEAAKQRSL